ncbi:MAG: hypothetical protein KME19_03115 [Microcoleus vaginatus WJT46-NPBG5]|jgi:hypothetical protein|nr:hypothetical protein [Microcoleus vaginatus WJT46-NPBG5]
MKNFPLVYGRTDSGSELFQLKSELPAPLFFERVVRDYISEFAIEEEEMEVAEQDLEE